MSKHPNSAMYNPSESIAQGSRNSNSGKGASSKAIPSPRIESQGDLFADDVPTTSLSEESHFAIRRALEILVVDDNGINRKVIRTILQKLGYQCLEASRGQEALEIVDSRMIDYIFMDLDMPEMSGIETSTQIRAAEAKSSSDHKIEIIAVTANISDETRLLCKRAGMNGFLEKPISASMIKDQLLRSWARIRAKN